MKKLFTVIAVSSFALVSANQYNQQSENQSYDQKNADQSDQNQSYNTTDANQSYNQKNSYGQQQSNPSYGQQQPNQSYGQQQSNSSYGQQQANQSNQQNPSNDKQQSNQSYGQQKSNQSNDQQKSNQSNDQQKSNQSNGQQKSGQQQSPQTNEQRNRGRQAASDQGIRQEIQDELSPGWFAEGYPNVTFDVNNGDVILRGTVDSLRNKNSIEKGVKKIVGVNKVDNQLKVSKESANLNAYSESDLQDSERKYPRDSAQTPEDRQLNAKIRNELNDDYENLNLKTANGAVTISGTVDSGDDIQDITNEIKDITGVRSVDNQIKTKNQ
ncbi:MAG: BON domain-containing protein [Candidatus Protochlamydia sp.]|nr:BON domain-containing protein [Candidatus Protochlamydia sp.]